MTTICTDGRIMAADSMTHSSFIHQRQEPKLFRLKDGSVIGFAGCCQCWGVAFKYFNGEGDKPVFKEIDFSALILNAKGEVYYVNEEFVTCRTGAPYSIGSGSGFAMGAMLAGASPRNAVKIAIKLDASSGGRVKTLLPKPRLSKRGKR